ncbi:unnamed protein product [Ceratitis capitata]|uniref:(Mediterranean fruit fly) hypothetical protein n=1 Tax=Ceratitis capitata TaxID=7213 RepID=A0A811UUL4_CERCA|nr:unnamed protein product [Ceratitis capitata]
MGGSLCVGQSAVKERVNKLKASSLLLQHKQQTESGDNNQRQMALACIYEYLSGKPLKSFSARRSVSTKAKALQTEELAVKHTAAASSVNATSCRSMCSNTKIHQPQAEVSTIYEV